MNIQNTIETAVKKGFLALYDIEIPSVEFQATRKEFEGDITVVVFPMLKYKKGNPVEIGKKLGKYLVENVEEVANYNVVKGFLNLVIDDAFYINFFNKIYANSKYGFVSPKADKKAFMVEYSSPNTNKPLHLGHVRNNLLGYSVAEIIKAAGKKVYKTQIINDRGIHICKSMLAWKKYGNGETPSSTGIKGDKLVGKYYVEFDKQYKKQLEKIGENARTEFKQLVQDSKSSGKWDFENHDNPNLLRLQRAFQNALTEYLSEKLKKKPSEFKNKDNYLSDFILSKYDKTDKQILDLKSKFRKARDNFNFVGGCINDISDKEDKKIILLCIKHIEQVVEIFDNAKQMLSKWEARDKETVALWKKMNGWVYDGFDITYKNLGVDFDTLYYESNTYLLGKDVIEQGLKSKVFYKKEDGSVWCDLTDEGLDEKLVLRSDGTAVYMTQDIGTAIQRVKDFPDVGGMIYTVGNEQDYHFQILFLILKKLGFDWAKNLYHLSYGMVDLPSGKMKSREGTVVDADDLITEMTETAKTISSALGKLDGYSDTEKEELYKTIGLGALKYFILKVDPKKRILFDPKSSIDFQGNTGPFIQYTYARIQSIIRKADFDYSKPVSINLHKKEKELIKQLEIYPQTIQQAATNYSPAIIANYTYDLVKEFNSFYQNVSILGETNQDKKIFRVQLAEKVAETIKSAFSLLGIQVPERM